MKTKRLMDDDEQDFKGQNYIRMIIARAVAFNERLKGNPIPASSVADQRWGKHAPKLAQILKANEVSGGSSTSGAWGAELVQADQRYTGDFIEYLHSQTVYDRLPLTDVPANVNIKGQDGAAIGYWVGQQKPIPASAPDFFDVELSSLKVGALAAVSNDLIYSGGSYAEMLFRNFLVKASAQRVDVTFLSAAAAVSGVSPAGILYGVSPGTSYGSDHAGVLADIKALKRPFITALNASGLMFVMHPSQAAAIGLLENAAGLDAFPGINEIGGVLKGTPVITGDNCDGGHLILLKPSDIWRIGGDDISVEMSRHATIEMSSAPTGDGAGPTAQSQSPVNMFQTESTAIKVVRTINFAKRRDSAVAYICNVDYDGVES